MVAVDLDTIKTLQENLEKQELFDLTLSIQWLAASFLMITTVLVFDSVIALTFSAYKEESNIASDMSELLTSWYGPGGILPGAAYGQLLAIYLLQKDLCNAKYLWKRIPQNIKNTNPELQSIWKVGQKIWQRDWPNIYIALHIEWSENVQHIMKLVEETIRNRAIGLVSHAYSTVSIDDLCSFLGLPADQALRLVTEQGWTVDTATRMVVPKQPEPSAPRTASNDEQLNKLTEFVSFLEN